MTPNFCKSNGILWRRIGILSIVIIILLIVITSFVIFSKERRSCDNSCTSENCIKSVKELAENANLEMDPCQNFYSFTCGKWMNRYKNETYSMTNQMKHTMQLSIKDVLSGLESNSSTKSGKLRIVYDSCIDYESAELNSVPSILKFFKLLGMEEWPNLSNEFKFSSPSLEEAIGILIGYDEFPFIDIKRGKKNKNKLYDIMINVKDGQKNVDNFEKLLVQIVLYFKALNYDATNIVKDYMLISKEVLTILPKGICVENCDFQTVNVECSSLPERHEKLICEVAQYLVRHNGLEEIFSTDHLVLNSAKPTLLLYSLQQTYSHRQLANYFAMSFLSNHLAILGQHFRDLTNFVLKDNWELCTSWMSTFMPQPLAQTYFSKKLPLQKIREVHAVVEAYKKAADGLLEQQPWLNENMKRKLRNNLSNLASSHLLWMKYLNDGTFDGLMDKYLPSNSSFLWNVLDYKKQQFNFNLLNTIPSSAQIVAKIFEPGAQHTLGFIELLFGILVPPVYDSERPRWMNYASLGFVVAHEIGHSLIFYFSTNEISDEAFEKIKSTATCLVGQYSNFTHETSGEKVNGSLTYVENMADLIAIELIEKITDTLKDDFSPTCIPEFPYSTRQLYYILVTQFWCKTESLEMDLEDEHAPARFRMTGVMQNAKEFSKVFQCEESSYMNPETKCSFFNKIE